jgi:hypothetical protein
MAKCKYAIKSSISQIKKTGFRCNLLKKRLLLWQILENAYLCALKARLHLNDVGVTPTENKTKHKPFIIQALPQARAIQTAYA